MFSHLLLKEDNHEKIGIIFTFWEDDLFGRAPRPYTAVYVCLWVCTRDGLVCLSFTAEIACHCLLLVVSYLLLVACWIKSACDCELSIVFLCITSKLMYALYFTHHCEYIVLRASLAPGNTDWTVTAQSSLLNLVFWYLPHSNSAIQELLVF